MFAHKVIEDISKSELRTALKGYAFNHDAFPVQGFDGLLKTIHDAQKFHIGTIEDLEPIAMKRRGHPFFWGESGDVRLPYKVCWFDLFFNKDSERGYSCDEQARFVKENNIEQEQIASSRRGILSIELDDNVLFCVFFNYLNNMRQWNMSLTGEVVFIDHIAKDNYLATKFLYSFFSNQEMRQNLSNLNVVPVPLIPYMDADTLLRFHLENTDELSSLNTALLLLSCKNIETELVTPPEALNKKRKKKNKLPIFTYKNLVIKPMGKKQKSVPQHLWENRIHLCRGHFKTYTKDAPLFGRYTGRFWWQPSVRGRNKEGMIHKDYEVKT
ncbi:MAG: hypothetical protein ACOCQT_00140 [Desulfovermiculus sp.]